MITTYFDISHQRTIEAAFNNRYSNGAKHPTRVMKQHDLIYMLKGEWEIIQENEIYLAHEGDVVVLTAHAHHSGRKPCADGTETIYLHTNVAENEIIDLPVADSCHIPIEALTHCKGNENVRRGFQNIVECYAIDTPIKSQRLSVLFNKLILDIFDCKFDVLTADKSIVKKIEIHFLNNPQVFFSNKELADLLFMGEKSFTEKFKAIAGISPHQYQINFKLNIIKDTLIACPEMKISELAQNFGFCDEFYLSKSFKKRYGISPYSYKKRFYHEK